MHANHKKTIRMLWKRAKRENPPSPLPPLSYLFVVISKVSSLAISGNNEDPFANSHKTNDVSYFC